MLNFFVLKTFRRTHDMQDNGSTYTFYDVIIRDQRPENNIFARAVNLLVLLS